MLGHLDLGQAEAAHHLDQDHDPRHDRGRPARVKAGHFQALLQRLRRKLRVHALDRPSDSLEPWTASGSYGSSAWSIAASEVGVPATPMPASAWAKSDPLRTPSINVRTSLASDSSSLCSAGSWAMWRSVWRTVPAWSEAWKDTSDPEPMTSSVEPPPMSTTSTSSSAAAPGSRPGTSAEPRRRPRGHGRRARNARAARRRTRRDSRHRGRPRSRPRPWYPDDGAPSARGTRRRCCRRPRLPRSRAAMTVDAASEARDVECRSSSAIRPSSSTSATKRRVEFEPMSTTATRTERSVVTTRA